MVLDKFIPPFINFIMENCEINNHLFVILHKKKFDYGLTNEYPIVWIDKYIKIFDLLKYMYNSEKIIIHGLWHENLVKLLFLQPWLLKKCYWVMWGGDFYFPEKQSWLKKQVIKRIGHFITYIKGDYELVQKWYGATGKYHECFMYPSNLYKGYDIKQKEHTTINIQVGNSADPTNNHIDVFEKLKQYKDENIKIFVPLSYGNQQYAEEVIAKGQEIFGNKFIPLTDFMPFEAYLDFLSEIDIAVFAHKRQQAMGNTITLLGLGKKVYMRSDVTPWQLFEDIDVRVFDVKNIEIELINEQTKKENQQKIKEYFSTENYLQQLKNLFGNE
jgi:hypothetical protein